MRPPHFPAPVTMARKRARTSTDSTATPTSGASVKGGVEAATAATGTEAEKSVVDQVNGLAKARAERENEEEEQEQEEDGGEDESSSEEEIDDGKPIGSQLGSCGFVVDFQKSNGVFLGTIDKSTLQLLIAGNTLGRG